jgi:hypothetical protein
VAHSPPPRRDSLVTVYWCPGCQVALRPWSPQIALYYCPCCSSRFDLDLNQVHWGSHNDYATYLCTWGRP